MLKISAALIVSIAASLLCAATPEAEEEEWGSLKGRFVVDGALEAPPQNPPNQTVVVDKRGNLANAVLYLRVPRGKTIGLAPWDSATLKIPAVLDMNGSGFRPHILAVRVGQQLKITNSDPIAHNANIQSLGVNPLLPANQNKQVAVRNNSPVPMPVFCNIHPGERAYLLSLEHPYVAVSGKDGSFEIKDIPTGTHELQFWHESPGYLKFIKFNGGTTDARGRAKIKISAGQNELGEIKIPAAVLKYR